MPAKRWHLDSETGPLRDVLLCPPHYYHWIDTNAVAHATLAAASPTNTKRRLSQYHELEAALISADVTLHHIIPEPHLPYQVYTRDSSQTTPWGPVLTSLAMPQRRGEYASLLNFHAQYDGFYKYSTQGTLEGGDIHIVQPGLLILGHSGIRTTGAGLDQFADHFTARNWEVVKVPFPEHFLHLDVLFCMAAPRLAIACIEVLGSHFEAILNDRQIKIIPASYSEVMAMSCNLLALGNDRVISPAHSTRLNAVLRAEGITVLDPELDEFSRGGGSVHCMTMPLLRDSI